jgi:hypothetical protein
MNITAARLKSGDILEPDGERVLSVAHDRERRIVEVTFRPHGSSRQETWRLTERWPLRLRMGVR